MEVFEANTFENIYNLRLLKLNGVQLSGTYQAFPKRLRWLYWRGFPSEYLPSDIPLENLVSLDLRYSKLKQFWKGTKVLRSLKILNLSHSPELVKTPDFSRIPNLEKLILKACPSLFEIDESIVELQRIELLNLQDCENLRKLPRNINMVESLVEINISGCSNLMGAMEELEKMKSIRVFCASRMDIDHLLTREVVPQGSSPPRMLMSLTSLPSSLTHLNLSHCNLTENAFPGDFSTLSKLQQLFLDGNPISSLPKAIKDLTGLQTLDLSWCPKLQQILWPSIGLEKLVVTQCHALEKITAENRRVSRPYPVKIVSHGGCINLNYIQWGFKILPVREIDVELLNCIGFFNLDSMADVDAVIVNSIVWSRKKLPIQVLYETPLFTTVYLERKVPMFATFYPERKVPHWFSNKNRGSTVSFTATLSPHFRFRGLNLCMVYTLPAEPEWLACPIHFEIINKSSGSKTDYKPRYYGHPEEGGDLVWLSYCFQENLFRDGDEVEVSFGITSDGEIKECGVHLLYLEDEGQVSQYNSTLHHSWDSIVFPYVPCAEEMAQLPNDSSEAIIPHAEEAIPLSSVPSGNTRKRKAKAITDTESKTRKKSLRAISSGPSQKTSESSSISEKPKRNAITTKTPTPTKQSKRTQTKKLAGSSGEKPITKKSKRTKIVDAFEETEEGNSSQSSQIQKSSFSLGETNNTEQAIDQFEFGNPAVSDPLLQDDRTPVMQENPLFRENPLLQDDNSLMQVNEGHSSSHSTLPAAPSVLLSFSGTSPSKSATSPSAIVTFEGHVSLKNSWQAAPSNLLPSSTLQVQSPGEVFFADLMDPIELEGLIARIEKPPIQSTPLSSNEAAVHIQRGLLISLQSSTISIDDIITRTNGIISVLKTFNVDLSPLYEKVKALVKYSALWAKVAGTPDRDVSLGELEAQCEEKKAKFEGLTSSYDEILASASKLTERVSSLEEEITRMKEVLKNLESELSSCKVNQSSSLSDLVKFSENISKSERDFNAAMDAVEQRKKKSVLFDTVKEALDDARASLVALSSL